MEQDPENRSIRIILVEDDEDDYILIRELLSEIPTQRFQLEWSSSYDNALQKMERFEHDVCLLDYRLGAHDGLELLEQAKSRGYRVPIIFLTGRGQYEVDLEAMKRGAADYLVKDQLTAPILERSIRYSIERARSRRALQKANDELEQKVQERTRELAGANEELKKSAEEIKIFAYSISHDLKSPTVSIHGLTKRLHDQYAPILNDRGREYCEKILCASEQIANLADKINSYITTKESPLYIEELDLNDVCRAIREEFSQRLSRRRIRWSGPAATARIRADRISMLRALRNLVDNALKYGGETLSKIIIEYSDMEDFHVISVKDDGVGISSENLGKIFGPFIRDEASRSVEGAGLGLAIVKEIAERHGGDVWIESSNSRGTSFSFSIDKKLL